MTQPGKGAKRAVSPGQDDPGPDYKNAAEELVRFINRLGGRKSGGWGLGGLFGQRAEKQAENIFTSDPQGPDIGADHAASAANHHLEGIRNAIANYLIPDRKGHRRGLQGLVMDITETRNPLLMYGGPLPRRPDGLFVLAANSNKPPPANGREALYNDVRTLIAMAKICEQDFEDKRRQGRGYHTEFGYGRISYLDAFDSYIRNRQKGQSHDNSLPVRLTARNFRKIGKPANQPDNKP